VKIITLHKIWRPLTFPDTLLPGMSRRFFSPASW